MTLNSLYYHIRPYVPRSVQIAVRRAIVKRKRARCADVWPIDPKSGTPPQDWKGWPEGKKFAFVITHDVETKKGVDRVLRLAEIDAEYGFRSSFNLVAEDYEIPEGLTEELVQNGFEVGLHGLTHRGNPYESRDKFERDALRINQYLKAWNITGFRTPSMYHNLDWIASLDVAYDSSTFDTDPFEPQPDGLGTIFPKWISANSTGRGYLELPYTLPQDFMLFIVMKEKSTDIWKRKLDWIVKHGGMALLLTHPDYMRIDQDELLADEYSTEIYSGFLRYVNETYAGQYWSALPSDLSKYWVFSKAKTSQSGEAPTRPPRIITVDPFIDPRWDAFVGNHPFGWICHLSGWKRVIEESFTHIKGHYLAVEDDAGKILAGLPLFEVRSWLTGDRLVSIPFATLSDPLIGINGEAKHLYDAAIELSARLRIQNIEVRSLYSGASYADPRFVRKCLFNHHYLELSSDLDSLRRSFPYKAVRYEINRSSKSGLVLHVGEKEDELRRFYLLHLKTRGRLGLPPQPYRFFEVLWKVFYPLGMITLLAATYRNELVACQIYLKFRDRVSMEFEVWDRQMRHVSPNHFLIWEAIKRFQAEGYKILDFGRTSVANAPLIDFKRRWSTHVVDLPAYYYSGNGAMFDKDRENTAPYKLMNRACKVAPMWALRSLGEFAYRHLG